MEINKVIKALPALLLFGCVHAHSSVPTGIMTSQANPAFAHIGKQAGSEGYQVFSHPDSLHVRYNDYTEIQFAIPMEGTQLMMGVIVGQTEPPPPAGMLQEATKKGLEWIEMAKKAMSGAPAAAPAPAPVVEAAPAPAVEASAASCKKLFACYAQLATDFCSAGATECQFKLEISGTDEDGCKEVLTQVPALIQPLMMMKPGYTTPVICQ